MKGVKLTGDGEAGVQEWDRPALGPNEVRIDVGATALCRSDMYIYHGEDLVGSDPPGTYIPGHEPAGTVAEVGSNVDYLVEGDRVAVNCFSGCDHCEYCRRGEPNLCEEREILGFDRHGSDAEELVTPATTCLPIPDGLRFAAAAVATDAIGNLYSTLTASGVSGADVVGVVGMGPMGLSGVLNADALGAEVVAFEPVDHRREKALELGADHGVDPTSEDPQDRVDAVTDGDGLDVVVDCSGSEPGVQMALDLVGKHGTVTQIGELDEVTINPSDQFLRKKATYQGSWYFETWEWPDIARFIVDKIGVDRAEGIISHEYPLEDEAVGEAFRKFDDRETQKVIFTP